MNYPVKSSNGYTLIPIESKLMENRKIFIEGTIDDEMACSFVKEIMMLNLLDQEKPIDVFVTSRGGEVNSGLQMYDAIQGSKAPVRMFCNGKAFSMGAVLVASGNHGRYILPHSQMMIHEPLVSDGIGGNCSSIKSISDSLIETRNKMNQILSKHTGKSEQEIAEASRYDHYFTAQESVDFGLCDAIMDFGKAMELT